MLTLQLIGRGDPSRTVLDERPFKGGRLTIGRGDKSAWRLADESKMLSKIHCEIFNRGEDVFLVDSSSNGVFLNGARMRMAPNEPAMIRAGDRFEFGNYEIHATAPKSQRDQSDQFGEFSRSGPLDSVDIVGDWLGGHDQAAAVLGRPVKPAVSDLIDDMNAAPRDPFAPDRPDAIPDAPRGRGELSDAFIAPLLAEQPASRAAGAIPADWHQQQSTVERALQPTKATVASRIEAEREFDMGAPLSAPPPAEGIARPAEAAGDGEALAAFLGGAGLDPAVFSGASKVEILRRAGAVYRQAVLNYSDILRDRSFLKNEFRIERTLVGSQGNNPLKFLTAQQAAVHLLLPPEAGFIDGATAVREAGEDIKKHQIAVMSGLRMALQAVLDRFRPEALLGAGAAKKTGLRLPGADQADISRAWDRFKILHATCEEEGAQRTDNFLNTAFRRGYELQLERLEGVDPAETSRQ